MKILIGGLWHETNTFAAGYTDLEGFRQYQYAEGQEIIEKYRGTRTELGGFLDQAALEGWQLVPTVYAAALPSALIRRDTYEFLVDRLLSGFRNPVDGVLLTLHGAMVAEGVDDCEADLLSRVRDALGPQRPLVATFDIHANLSEAAFRYADLLIGYDTYPHVDVYDRGLEAARWLAELVRTGSRPAKAFRKLPVLTVPQAQETDVAPMRNIMAAVHDWESRHSRLSTSVAVGFPYADVPRVGVSVVAYLDNGGNVTESCAEALAQEIWEARRNFVVRNVSSEESVQRAMRAAEGPVILVDVADNIGGGAPGDGTELLRTLLAAGASRAVVTIADPDGVEQAVAAGVGSEVELRMGGKHDRFHGEPILARAKVLRITEGAYTHRGSYMTGLRVSMGKTAVVECSGVEVMLTERKAMPFDAEQLRSVGIEPSSKHIIVVKSAIAWKAAYEEIAKEVIYVDTPGICSSNLNRFTYRAIPRPIYPLDEI